MTSHVRHRRTTVPGGPPAASLEPGELALNLADGKLYTTEAATHGATPLIGVTHFKLSAKYAEGEMVNHAKMIWIAKGDVEPGAFDEAAWTKLSSADVANEVDDAMAAHVADLNPHPVYATDQDLLNHAGASDPHPQYATDADLNAHKAAVDPYPQYTTTAEAQALANAAADAARLPFTPVQQGGGSAMLGNKVFIGWSATGKLLVQVDGNPFGQVWPINADAALTVRNGGAIGGTPLTFSWADPGSGGGYVWSGDGPSSAFVRPVSSLRVANAANADAVNGISGWAYRNDNNNPAYLWATEGNGAAQHLTSPGALSVNYANSAGYCSGTTENANKLLGQAVGYWINNGSTAVVNIRNNGTIQLLAGISGYGDVWWPVNGISDARLKSDIAPTCEDSLAKIARLKFKQFRFRTLPWHPSEDDPPEHADAFRIDDGRLHRVGVTADEVELIDPDWVGDVGTYKQLDINALLMASLHAIQQLKGEFDAYKVAHP
jgi:hypothetical protein